MQCNASQSVPGALPQEMCLSQMCYKPHTAQAAASKSGHERVRECCQGEPETWRTCTGRRCRGSRCQNILYRNKVNRNRVEGETILERRDLTCIKLDIWEQKTKHPRPLHFTPPSPLLLHVVSFLLSLLFTAGIQVFAPGVLLVGAERCKVHFCPPVRACVGQRGRVAPAERTRTVLLSCHIPVNEGYGKRRGGGGAGGRLRRVELGLEIVCVWVRRGCLHSPRRSRPVLSCPLRSRGAGKCTCLKSTPWGQMPICSPISEGF